MHFFEETVAQQPHNPLHDTSFFTAQQKMEVCFLLCQDKKSKGRNNFVFELACFMCKNGIEEHDVLQYCSTFEESDFQRQSE